MNLIFKIIIIIIFILMHESTQAANLTLVETGSVKFMYPG